MLIILNRYQNIVKLIAVTCGTKAVTLCRFCCMTVIVYFGGSWCQMISFVSSLLFKVDDCLVEFLENDLAVWLCICDYLLLLACWQLHLLQCHAVRMVKKFSRTQEKLVVVVAVVMISGFIRIGTFIVCSHSRHSGMDRAVLPANYTISAYTP